MYTHRNNALYQYLYAGGKIQEGNQSRFNPDQAPLVRRATNVTWLWLMDGWRRGASTQSAQTSICSEAVAWQAAQKER
jgi:hypothetical protein